jgi:hypothetical protein
MLRVAQGKQLLKQRLLAVMTLTQQLSVLTLIRVTQLSQSNLHQLQMAERLRANCEVQLLLHNNLLKQAKLPVTYHSVAAAHSTGHAPVITSHCMQLSPTTHSHHCCVYEQQSR